LGGHLVADGFAAINPRIGGPGGVIGGASRGR